MNEPQESDILHSHVKRLDADTFTEAAGTLVGSYTKKLNSVNTSGVIRQAIYMISAGSAGLLLYFFILRPNLAVSGFLLRAEVWMSPSSKLTDHTSLSIYAPRVNLRRGPRLARRSTLSSRTISRRGRTFRRYGKPSGSSTRR